MSILCVIPARYASRRFEGKLLVLLGGKPLIQHVYEGASACRLFQQVVVATDDERIRDTVAGFQGQTVLTSSDHVSGSDRVAEVAASSEADIIVNVQGDEPFVNARILEQLVEPLIQQPCIPMATLCKQIKTREVLQDPNVVKVVTDTCGHALYFSRSPIPYAGRVRSHVAWEHIGIYAYRRDFLLKINQLEPTELEAIEGLEQLRVLENGYKILVIPTRDHMGVSVDTPEDLEIARQKLHELGLT